MNAFDKAIDEIRSFNRFYTVNMGLLNSDYLETKYSIAETRILFEINMRGKCIQSDIAKILHIDKSYLSRLIKRFCRNGLVEKNMSDKDKRAAYISLTEKGIAETEELIRITNNQIKSKISCLSLDECKRLCSAMETVISIFGKGE